MIVGGVAGGAAAAARLRRLEEDAEIIILERSGFVSYANCGLPYYIGGGIFSGYHFYRYIARENRCDPSPTHLCGIKR